jgi:FkbM family methyltransferase
MRNLRRLRRSIGTNSDRILRRLRRLFGMDLDRFLGSVRGVIHVGGNLGQERSQYARLGLDVLWIEPIPEIFATLRANLASFPRQSALEALVTDVDNREYEFHVANNSGESSSIFDLKDHRDVWPDVAFTKSIKLHGVTLPTLLARERIDVARFDALVMDTQGSELLVLQGAEALLPRFSYIKTEVPDFEAYEGCVQLEDLSKFLAAHGFRELVRNRWISREAGGHYYDIVYRRSAEAKSNGLN